MVTPAGVLDYIALWRAPQFCDLAFMVSLHLLETQRGFEQQRTRNSCKMDRVSEPIMQTGLMREDRY
jgi:hypothetical protein